MIRAEPPAVLERRQHIERLQRVMEGLESSTGPDAYPTRHHFAPGAYAREILLPEGSCVVGKIHRHAHVNVLAYGRCVVATPGRPPEFLEGPRTFVSEPGTKRVVLALTDVVWTTIHVTDETDLEKIEAEVIAPDFAALEHDTPSQLSAGGSA